MWFLEYIAVWGGVKMKINKLGGYWWPYYDTTRLTNILV